MYMYVLVNNNTGMYLKWFRDINFKHYVIDIEEASKLTYQQAYQIKNKYNHPENWRIKRWKKIKLTKNKR